MSHHYTEAGLNDKAIPFWQQAGERALITYAHEEALAHFQRGLTAKEGRPMDAETAALLFGLGRAQGATDLVREAWVTLNRAFDYDMELGDIPRIVDVAKYPLLFTFGLSQATSLVERALVVVPEDSLEAGYLLSRHGMLLMLEANDYEGAEHAFSRAMAIADHANDLTLETQTLVNSADADWYQMRGPEVLKKSLRAIEIAHHNNDPSTDAWSHFLAAFELLVSGDPINANEFAQEMLGRGETLRDRGVLAQACLINMLVTRLTGDWASAREFCDRGLNLEPENTWLLRLRAVQESEVGEAELSGAYMNRLLAIMRRTAPGPNQAHLATAWAIPVIARITEDSVWFDIAEEAAQAVITSPACTPRMASLRFAEALMSIRENDLATAAQQYRYLVEVRDTVTPGDALTCGLAGADRVLGLLSQTIGKSG